MNVITTKVYDKWYRSIQSPRLKKKVDQILALLFEHGWKLGRPYADSLYNSDEGVKELRVQTDNAVVRIFYAFDSNRDLVLLTAGDKAGVSSDRFYKVMIDAADKLQAAHEVEIDRKSRLAFRLLFEQE